MPDITMCKGFGCPKQETCYRCTATPGRWQSWFTERPWKDGPKTKAKLTQSTMRDTTPDGFRCDHYWEERDAAKKHKQEIVSRLNDKSRLESQAKEV